MILCMFSFDKPNATDCFSLKLLAFLCQHAMSCIAMRLLRLLQLLLQGILLLQESWLLLLHLCLHALAHTKDTAANLKTLQNIPNLPNSNTCNCYINLHCQFWEAGEQKQQVSSNKCSTSHTNHFGHARSWPGELVFLLLILLHVSRPFVNMLVAICICKHKAGSNAHDAYHINIHQSYQ